MGTNATVNDVPANPGSIAGPDSVCPGQPGAGYSLAPVSGATSYSWTVPAGAAITAGAGTTAITVVFPNSSGSVGITPVNACGLGNASVKAVTMTAPPIPGSITGTTPVCAGQTGVNYSISSVSGATSYIWAVPSDATITSGQGTAAIIVTFGNSSTTTLGNISVSAANIFCASVSKNLTVTVNGASNFNASPSPAFTNTNILFSPTVPGATYSWTFSGGTPASSTVQNPLVSWSSPGSYSVSLTVTQGSCNTNTVKTITIANPVCPSSQTFTYTGSMQTFIVPSCASSVTIEAWGAQGATGNAGSTENFKAGGLGARMRGDFTFTPGDTLLILVGQTGAYNPSNGGSGGGGSFVVKGSNYITATPLVVAGGGGGGGKNGDAALMDAAASANGRSGTTDSGAPGGGGGINGNGGGESGGSPPGGGGGGFYTDGVSQNAFKGGGFRSSAGIGGNNSGYGGGGGFWGGPGGGGGYSGGGSGGYITTYVIGVGGGGGSYNGGTNTSNSGGVQTGNGKVVISW